MYSNNFQKIHSGILEKLFKYLENIFFNIYIFFFNQNTNFLHFKVIGTLIY